MGHSSDTLGVKKCQIHLFVLLATMLVLSVASHAQGLPPCGARPSNVDVPRAGSQRVCLEQVIQLETVELAATGLATTADGALFVAQTDFGTILLLTDTDGDGLPDERTTRYRDLRQPYALVVDGETLYVAGSDALYRCQAGCEPFYSLPHSGTLSTGMALYGDALFVGIAASCGACIGVDPADVGRVLRVPLPAMDEALVEAQVIAQGLHHPAALMAHPDLGILITDTPPATYHEVPQLDELNTVPFDVIDADEPINLGFPRCLGAAATSPIGPATHCETTQPPLLTFQTHSLPIKVLQYEGAAFPSLADAWIVALAGSAWHADGRGHGIIAFWVRDGGAIAGETLIPFDPAVMQGDTAFHASVGGPVIVRGLQAANLERVGFFPHLIHDVAISPEGWVYFSVGGGTIYVLRPR